MKIIGITGGTGAGKSILAQALADCGATVVDADKISKQVSAANGAAFDEIVEKFGEEILTQQGEIDRKALGKVVFSNPQKLELLEQITHKHIFEEMQKQINQCQTDVAVLDVPLLFNSDFPFECDVTVAVIADPEMRLRRIVARDNVSEDMARTRMKNQLSNDDYRRLADICFENNGNIDAAEAFAKNLLLEK